MDIHPLNSVVIHAAENGGIPTPLAPAGPAPPVVKTWKDTADTAVIVFAATVFSVSVLVLVGSGAGHVVTLTPAGYASDGLVVVLSGLLCYFAWSTGILSLKEQVDRERKENDRLQESNRAFTAQNLQYHGMLKENQQQITALQKTTTTLQVQITQYQAQLEDGKKQVEALTKTGNDLHSSQKELQREIEKNQALLAENQNQIESLETLNKALNASTIMLAKGERAAEEMLKSQEDLLQREKKLEGEREELFAKEQNLLARQEEETKMLVDVQRKLTASENRLNSIVDELQETKGKLVAEKLTKAGVSWEHLKRAMLQRAQERKKSAPLRTS